MKIIFNITLEVEMTPRIAYSVSALMKLNIILEVIKTDYVNLLPMHENKVYMLATTVVTGGFGRRAAIRATRRTWMQSARSIWVATVPTMITSPFGPLYG